MAQQKTKAQLHAEIQQLDEQINDLVKNMPSAALDFQVNTPVKLWGLAAVFIAVALWGKGIIPIPLPAAVAQALGSYSILILIVGGIFAVLALLGSFRSLFGLGRRKNRRFHVEAAKVETLKGQRDQLAQQLSQMRG